jgi:DNA-binding CsgD family transcriptional regulator
LSPRDCQRLVNVLDTVSGAVGDDSFFAQLQESLGSHFGWADGLVVDVPAECGPFPEPADCMDHFHSNRTTSFLDEYVGRWYGNNPFKTDGALSILGQRGVLTLAEARPFATDRQWDFVERYLGRAGVSDLLEGVIDADSEGSALLLVYSPEDTDLGPRERAIMRRLTRYLAPWVRDHLATARVSREHALLSVREREAAQLAARGLSNREIARALHISTDTVKKHLTKAMAKTRSASRTQLAMRVQR